MTKYPINQRDENQIPLPHGVKAVLIGVTSFLLLMAIMAGLLQLVTKPGTTYTILHTEARYEQGLFGLLSRSAEKSTVIYEQPAVPVGEMSILERLSSLDKQLDMMSKHEDVIDVPDVHFTIDF